MTDDPFRVPPMRHANIRDPAYDMALVRLRERIEEMIAKQELAQRYSEAIEQGVWRIGMFNWIAAFCCGGGFGFLIALWVLTH